MQVELIEYVRPHGERRRLSVEVSDDLQEKVEAIKHANLRVTAEIIGPNVSYCIENDEEDLACEIAVNGPGENGTIATLERMLREFTIPKQAGGKDGK